MEQRELAAPCNVMQAEAAVWETCILKALVLSGFVRRQVSKVGAGASPLPEPEVRFPLDSSVALPPFTLV